MRAFSLSHIRAAVLHPALLLSVALAGCDDAVVAPDLPAKDNTAATLEMIASSTWLARGETVTLSWYATNVLTCQGSWQDDDLPPAGSVQLSPANSVTFSITCANSGGSVSRIRTIHVEEPPTEARVLAITPTVQEEGPCCWTAAAIMVLRYLGRFDVSAGDDYTCVNLLKSVPDIDCTGGRSTCEDGAPLSLARTRVPVAFRKGNVRIFAPVTMVCGELLSGSLTMREMREEVDADRPMIVEMTERPSDANAAARLHTAVIVGYELNGTDNQVIVNDPYPFAARGEAEANTYLLAGGEELTGGQYRISLAKLMNAFTWERTIVRIR